MESLQKKKEVKNPDCPSCKTNFYVIRNGKRKTKSGENQRWLCKKCKIRFVESGYLDEVKREAIELSKEVSLRKVSEWFRKHKGLEISHSTIARWIIREKKEARIEETETKISDPKTRECVWEMFNDGGDRSSQETTKIINNKFDTEIDESIVASWIEEEITKRGGCRYGDMDCFSLSDKTQKWGWCKKLTEQRSKNQYICKK